MPFLREIPFSDGTHVYVWEVSETIDELTALCRQKGVDVALGPKPKAGKRLAEVLVEHLLLNIIFGQPVALEHTTEGRPYVSSRQEYLSVTHTSGLVCIAVNQEHSVGIDVERRGERVLRVRTRFLNEAEQRFIAADDVKANLMAWTAKEALYKVVEDDHATMHDDLRLDPFKAGLGDTMTFTASCKGREYTLTSLAWRDYILTLAVERCYAHEIIEQETSNQNNIEL